LSGHGAFHPVLYFIKLKVTVYSITGATLLLHWVKPLRWQV